MRGTTTVCVLYRVYKLIRGVQVPGMTMSNLALFFVFFLLTPD